MHSMSCVDIRTKRATFPWIKSQLLPPQECQCGDPVDLTADLHVLGSVARDEGVSLANIFHEHCSRATGFENRACNTHGK